MNFIVFGDSHIDVFRYMNNKQDNYKFHTLEVPGATAQGAVNPNSKTNALQIFSNCLNQLENIKKYNKFMIMLGEVDCGFVIWVRSKKYKISVDEQIKNSVNNLFNFIKNVVEKYFNKSDIIVIGSILPTIKDNTDKRFLNGARREVEAKLKERINKTLEYNNKLKEESNKNGYKYIDITKYILDKEKDEVFKQFLNKDPYNHHLDNENTYNLWLNEIKKLN